MKSYQAFQDAPGAPQSASEAATSDFVNLVCLGTGSALNLDRLSSFLSVSSSS